MCLFFSGFQAKERSKAFSKDAAFEDVAERVQSNLTCCRDCSINFEKEAQSIVNSVSKKVCTITTSNLPTWLQNCKEEKSDTLEVQVCIIVNNHTLSYIFQFFYNMLTYSSSI